MAVKRCANCAAFATMQKECRRRPPTAFPIQMPSGAPAFLGAFPPTKPENWCAEWQPGKQSTTEKDT